MNTSNRRLLELICGSVKGEADLLTEIALPIAAVFVSMAFQPRYDRLLYFQDSAQPQEIRYAENNRLGGHAVVPDHRQSRTTR